MRIATLILALLVAAPSLAADGDKISAQSSLKGAWKVDAHYLCDSAAAGASTCTEFDILGSNRDWPDYFTIELQSETSCSASPEVTVYGSQTSGASSAPARYGLMSSTSHGAAILTSAAVSAARFPPASERGPMARYITSGLANMTSCTDLNVVILLHYDQRRP